MTNITSFCNKNTNFQIALSAYSCYNIISDTIFYYEL